MTETERARAHLKKCQGWLVTARTAPQALQQGYSQADIIVAHEANVLAALSWVWDAQERERSDREIKTIRELMASLPILDESPGCVGYSIPRGTAIGRLPVIWKMADE